MHPFVPIGRIDTGYSSYLWPFCNTMPLANTTHHQLEIGSGQSVAASAIKEKIVSSRRPTERVHGHGSGNSCLIKVGMEHRIGIGVGERRRSARDHDLQLGRVAVGHQKLAKDGRSEIGRASCRDRV